MRKRWNCIKDLKIKLWVVPLDFNVQMISFCVFFYFKQLKSFQYELACICNTKWIRVFRNYLASFLLINIFLFITSSTLIFLHIFDLIQSWLDLIYIYFYTYELFRILSPRYLTYMLIIMQLTMVILLLTNLQ